MGVKNWLIVHRLFLMLACLLFVEIMEVMLFDASVMPTHEHWRQCQYMHAWNTLLSDSWANPMSTVWHLLPLWQISYLWWVVSPSPCYECWSHDPSAAMMIPRLCLTSSRMCGSLNEPQYAQYTACAVFQKTDFIIIIIGFLSAHFLGGSKVSALTEFKMHLRP